MIPVVSKHLEGAQTGQRQQGYRERERESSTRGEREVKRKEKSVPRRGNQTGGLTRQSERIRVQLSQ